MRRCASVLVLVLVLGAAVRAGDHGFYSALRELSSLTLDYLPRGNVSRQCQQASDAVRLGAQETQLWAMKIMDASAKLPAGLLNGNVNQFGDFDLCLSAEGETQEGTVKGRYCLVDFDVKLRGNSHKDINDRLHGYKSMTSALRDPGQRLPKLGSWRWGVCMPSACQADEISSHLKNALSSRLDGVAAVDLRLDPDLCYTAERPTISFGHWFAMAIFGLLAVCVMLGSLWDAPTTQSTTLHRALACFSIHKNWASLTKITSDGDDIGIVHGARAFNAIALLLSHKQMAQFFNPFVNSVRIGETMSGAWSMIGRSAILYTDTFILISGLLTAHSMVKELDRDKKLNVKRTFVSRYIRFTPNLLFIILICTYLTDFLGPGPQWGLVVSKYSHLCKANMWRNFFYIHNFFGFEDMCLTHTHQLGIDMQLFLVSPILVYLLWKNPKFGGVTILGIAAASTWLRYTVTLERQLSTVIYYGISVQRLFNTARHSYILPTHRATVYCMGLLLGFGARRGLGNIKISRPAAWFGWSAATGMAVVAMFGPAHMAIRGYVYDPMDAAIYNAFAPILWCLFLVWSAVAGWNQRGGWFYSLLTWKYFTVFSRISYAFYLVQFPIFFYNVGMQRTNIFYEGFFTILDIKEFAVIFFASVILTLAVDMPFQNLKKLRSPIQKISTKPSVDKPRTMNHG